MKVLVIGGVAAGTKTAAKLKREDRSAEVTIITRDQEISYAGCGLPYYVGGLIEEKDELIVNTPAKYAALTGVNVLTGREAVSLDAAAKTVQARNLETGSMETYSYDRLVIATGASAALPPLEGMDKKGVFKMRTPDDAISMRSYIEENNVKKAVVIGAGFIGLEVAENLKAQGISVTVIDFAPQVMPGIFDPEMAHYVKKHLLKNGIRVITGTKGEAVLGEDTVTGIRTGAGTLPCTLLVSAAGIRPNTDFLADSGIQMYKGTIQVDAQMKTSLPDIYAVGDCAMVTNRITGQPKWSPMGSSANLEGRTLAQILAGHNKTYPGVLGTAVVKLPGLNAGRTGLTEEQAAEAGYDVITALAVTDDKAHYYPDASFFITKLIADRSSRKLLGAQILGPGAVDKHLLKHGIRVITGTKGEAVLGEDTVTGIRTGAGTLPCTLLVSAAGIRPNTDFLADSGIQMYKGTIQVDAQMKTSLPDIYAVGDCAMVTNRITGQPKWSPMGSSANLEGRTLAQILAGHNKTYPGVLGTAVVKLPGLNAGRTGLTEEQAAEAGYDVITALAVTDDKAHYYPDASFFITKLIADRSSRKLLGAQILGPGAVDKMTDIAVMGISMGAVLEDFENLDFAYAPPFSTAIHPFVQAVYILINKLDGVMDSMTPAEYAAGKADDYKILDVAPAPSIPGAQYINLAEVNGELPGIAKDEKLLLVCAKGKRGYFLQNRLKHFGYTNTLVLEGAAFFNDVRVKRPAGKLPAEEITRVKGLGFLQDKRTGDHFNARVITRNGKITAEEIRTITEAAELYGSGEIAMTSRLTIEIQDVPYENIEPLREHLLQAGLETGGTGSKVRPVVSCKGTTCQYGLIDTFALSEEIHQRFYLGYHDVKLPHKFKIAVGGCPNNCVKPDLNDLGIIGQRVPLVDLEKCRGCKKCQIENTCPIKVAKMVDGKISIDPEACNHCGRCIGKCPFKAFEEYTNGYRIYIGGRWGKRVAQGRYLDKVFTDKEEVLNVVEKAILLFREQGITGERFSDTIERLGFENVQEQLLADDLLTRKQENLSAQKHLKGGATC